MGVSRRSVMTWESGKKRWRKMYGGKLYVVSCSTLGTDHNKEASYQAANAWWEKKRAEIDNPPLPAHPHQAILDKIDHRIAWAEEHGLTGVTANLERQRNDTEALPHWDADDLEGMLEYNLGNLGDFKLWDAKIEGNRTIGCQMARYLGLEEARMKSGLITVSEWDTVRRCLNEFRDWAGEGRAVESLDAEKLEGWWSHLLAQTCSVEYKKKKLRFAKGFISWLVEKGTIPVPPNLNSRRHRFGGGAKAVPTIPVKDAKTLIEKASGQLKLHLLLMTNCGFTQIDISDLKPSEVDWKAGRIKRKRSKTEDHEDVPVVDYPLWPETWELLQKYGKRDGKHALLTESGKTWVRDFIKPNGKRSKVDAIKSNYVHLAKRLKYEFSMKLLRKTSATMLGRDQPDSIVTLFLGHSPRTIAARHYQAPDPARFDAAVAGLRTLYGF